MRITLISLLLLSSCSGAQVKQRPDGTYAVECGSQKACLDRAARICQPGGYTLVGAHSNRKRYGVPGNEKLIGKDEIFVRCDKDRPVDTPDPQSGTWQLKHPKADATPTPSVPSASPATVDVREAVCRPGETQRCVGPGACDGGQACMADGSGFGPCDCGPAAPKPSP